MTSTNNSPAGRFDVKPIPVHRPELERISGLRIAVGFFGLLEGKNHKAAPHKNARVNGNPYPLKTLMKYFRIRRNEPCCRIEVCELDVCCKPHHRLPHRVGGLLHAQRANQCLMFAILLRQTRRCRHDECAEYGDQAQDSPQRSAQAIASSQEHRHRSHRAHFSLSNWLESLWLKSPRSLKPSRSSLPSSVCSTAASG